jgi:hypothetical protein
MSTDDFADGDEKSFENAARHVMSDGEWHRFSEIVARCGKYIPDGQAMRAALSGRPGHGLQAGRWATILAGRRRKTAALARRRVQSGGWERRVPPAVPFWLRADTWIHAEFRLIKATTPAVPVTPPGYCVIDDTPTPETS